MKDVTFGGEQSSAAPNISGSFSGHDSASGAFWVSGGSQWHGNRNNNGQKHTISFNASRSSSVYQSGVSEIRVKNRNYLPIIKLG